MHFKDDKHRMAVMASLNELNNSKPKIRQTAQQLISVDTNPIKFENNNPEILIKNPGTQGSTISVQRIKKLRDSKKQEVKPEPIKPQSIENFLEDYYHALLKLNPFTKLLVEKKGKISDDQYISLARTETWLIITAIKGKKRDFLDRVTDLDALKKAIRLYQELHL